ncbi:MAG: AMP-binding protein [Cellulomonadaceae bacterium]|nr:AMP-binding protein [Cellulomonadaceae bacterium]
MPAPPPILVSPVTPATLADAQRTASSIAQRAANPFYDAPSLTMETSGSTGSPQAVTLPASAVLASARATQERLDGPGRWVLALTPHRIAGFQVLLRAHLAEQAGVPRAFATSLAEAFADTPESASIPVYISVVPTQLHRVLAAGGPELELLARCSAVLVGGAALDPVLHARALAAHIPVIRTYGMTETCGGCVYDGQPLDGVNVRINEAGTIEIAGPMLASGYQDGANDAFFEDNGIRWFRTHDHGEITAEGILTVQGRADHVIITGGVNVAPEAVALAVRPALVDVLGSEPVEVCVIGIPDDEWGQAVTAVVEIPSHPGAGSHSVTLPVRDEGAEGPPGEGEFSPVDPASLARIRTILSAQLGGPAAPRQVYVTSCLPRLISGKVDCQRVIAILTGTPGAGTSLTGSPVTTAGVTANTENALHHRDTAPPHGPSSGH